MAGLTNEGFTVKSLEEITKDTEERLRVYDPEIDLDIASPDGQNVSIFSFIASTLWQQMGLVFDSYNPDVASGKALRNIGLLTGIPYGAASRSTAIVQLGGTEGTPVLRGSVVSDSAGNEFQVSFNTVIGDTPTSVQVVATQAGPVSVPAGSITTVKTVISGWDTVAQAAEGIKGGLPQTPQQYRNLRNRTVMRNSTSTTDHVSAKLYELGLGQASVINNDHPTDNYSDGTPPQHLHVVIGEKLEVTDEEIAQAILNTKGAGCPTWSQSGEFTTVEDDQGVSHDIYFDTAGQVNILVNMSITFLDDDVAGAVEAIKKAVSDDINSYLSGEDVIWSRLFTNITKFGKAQINIDAGVPQLFIGKALPLPTTPSDVAISPYEFAACDFSNVTVTVLEA